MVDSVEEDLHFEHVLFRSVQHRKKKNVHVALNGLVIMTLLCNDIVYVCAGNVWFYTKEINVVNIR